MKQNIPNDRNTARDFDRDLRGVVTQLIRVYAKRIGSPDPRSRLALALSERTGIRVTKRMLDDYTSESKRPARFPAVLVRDFSELIGSDALQRILLGPRLAELLELGEATERVLSRRKRGPR